MRIRPGSAHTILPGNCVPSPYPWNPRNHKRTTCVASAKNRKHEVYTEVQVHIVSKNMKKKEYAGEKTGWWTQIQQSFMRGRTPGERTNKAYSTFSHLASIHKPKTSRAKAPESELHRTRKLSSSPCIHSSDVEKKRSRAHEPRLTFSHIDSFNETIQPNYADWISTRRYCQFLKGTSVSSSKRHIRCQIPCREQIQKLNR